MICDVNHGNSRHVEEKTTSPPAARSVVLYVFSTAQLKTHVKSARALKG